MTKQNLPQFAAPVKVSAEGIPILQGVVNGRDLIAYCPHCRRFHTHSFAGEICAHYAAHCPDGSPFNTTGYYIAIGGVRWA